MFSEIEAEMRFRKNEAHSRESRNAKENEDQEEIKMADIRDSKNW